MNAKHTPFRTWTAKGSPALVHRSTVLDVAAGAYGRKGYERAKWTIGAQEYVSAVTANAALEHASA